LCYNANMFLGKAFCLLKFIAIALVLAACAVSPSVPPTPDFSDTFARADALIEAREYSAAVEILSQMANQSPADAAPLIRIGDIYLTQHRRTDAADAFSMALARDASDVSAWAGRATAELQSGNPVIARNDWWQVLAINPDSAVAYAGLGRAYLQTFNFDLAQDAFEKAKVLGDTESAWRLAALTLPVDVSAGKTWLAQADDSPKKDYLQTTLADFSADISQADVAATVGIALMQWGEFELAENALSESVRLNPQNAQAWAFLGHVRAVLGLPALEAFNHAKELDPALVLVPYFEGLYLRQQGLPEDAFDRFRSALNLDPQNLAVAIEAAATLADMGNLESAEVWYRAVVKAEPDNADYQQLLAEFFVLRSYRVAEAGIVAATRLTELLPQSAHAFDLRGWAKFQTGDFTGAESDFRQAINFDPDDVSARYHLGRLLKTLRRETEARAEFVHVINWDTGGQYRQRALKMLE